MNSIRICLVLAACCTAFTTANKAPYRFGYSVSDPLTGDMKEQQEMKDCDQVAGYYKTLDADGLMRTVVYNSHPLTGFNAQVTREPIGRPVAIAEPAVIPVTAAPILRTAAPLMGARIASGLAAPAVSSQMMHKVDVGSSWEDASIMRTAEIAAAPILRTAEIAAPAQILTATAAPLLETRIAAAAPAWSSQMMKKIDAAPILRPAIAETEVVSVTQAPILRTDYAAEYLEPARILTGGAAYAETNQASSVLHPAPISYAAAPVPISYAAAPAPISYAAAPVPISYAAAPAPISYAAAPARILAPAMSYGLPASSAASFQSYAGHWQNTAPLATAAVPIPYAGRFLGAAPIAATAATVLEPCK